LPKVIGSISPFYLPCLVGGPQAVALDLLTVVVRGSPVPLSEMLILNAFPAVIACVTKSDDHSVWQNGGECLRAYTSVAPEQVFNYRYDKHNDHCSETLNNVNKYS